MPGAARIFDDTTGHSCFSPRTGASSGSTNVMINNQPAVTVGTMYPLHGGCPNTPMHEGVVTSGSSTVFVNGKALAREGDPISCGDIIATGSQNVIIG